VETQITGFMDLMEDKPDAMTSFLKRYQEMIESADITMTPDDFKQLVVEGTAPIEATVNVLRRDLSTLINGLVVFRQEVLALLKNQ
jgi:hypothetical protein